MNKLLQSFLAIFLMLSSVYAASGTSTSYSGELYIESSAASGRSTSFGVQGVLSTQPVGAYTDAGNEFLVCLGANNVCLEPTGDNINPSYSVKVVPTSVNIGVNSKGVVKQVFLASNDGDSVLTSFKCEVDDVNENWVKALDCPNELKAGESKAVTIEFNGVAAPSLGVHNIELTFGNQLQATAQADAVVLVYENAGEPGEYDFIVVPEEEEKDFSMGVKEVVLKKYFIVNTGLTKLSEFTCFVDEVNNNWVSVKTDCTKISLEPEIWAEVEFEYRASESGKKNGETAVVTLLFNEQNAGDRTLGVSVSFTGNDNSLPTFGVPIDFGKLQCPVLLVTTDSTVVSLDWFVDGKPTCDPNLVITVTNPLGVTETSKNPSCVIKGKNTFTVNSSVNGIHKTVFDGTPFSIGGSSCKFTALHEKSFAASEIDLPIIALMLLAVLAFLGKKK